jgi:hypothetical protein
LKIEKFAILNRAFNIKIGIGDMEKSGLILQAFVIYLIFNLK